MIYILSGNIRTGKTRALLEWSKDRSDIDGLLCPDDADGKRYFLKIKSNQMFPLEVTEDLNEEIISVGNFKFLKSSFKLANEYLISVGKKKKTKYVVIDELGKLELRNEGLYEAAKKLISIYEDAEQHHLILVVRQSLIDEIIQHFQIIHYKTIETSELKNLN